MTTHISGTFDVQLTPHPVHDAAAGTTLGRMALDKRFHGELDATSRGEMLAARSATPGSAGYVALEQVSGTLQGRSGSFVLQHSGTMDRGAPQLSVTVVPDSATDELLGLKGRMAIRIEDGKHFYDFDFSF